SELIGREHYLGEFFPDRAKEPVLCDVDPEFMYDPAVPERMHRALSSDVRIVFMFRNPADRAYSQYLMSMRRGFEELSFEEALKAEPGRLAQGDPFKRSHFSYQDRGLYSVQIERFLEYFPPESMLFVLFEDFVRDRGRALSEICAFAGLDPGLLKEPAQAVYNKGGEPRLKILSRLRGQRHPVKDMLKPFIPPGLRWKMYDLLDKMNLGSKKPPGMSLETRSRLMEVYRDEIKRLEAVIGRDLSPWLEKK
ncbi:MAG: sulfotransferase, partial [Thermodesulfobacteriota bacterium]|nr:sulfotransferase [Thermodesulfobacteriota bacterium]